MAASAEAAELWLSPVGVTALDPKRERDFCDWCRRNKVLFPSAEIAAIATSGRSVVATRAIAKDDVVVEVPDDACLLAEQSVIADELAAASLTKDAQRERRRRESDEEEEEDDDSPSSSPDALLEVQALILALMAERLLGSKSRWAAYVEFFPPSSRELGGMPLFWSQRQRRRLRGTAARDKARARLQHPADAPTRVGELWRDVALPFILEGSPTLRRLLGLGNEEEEEAEEDGDGDRPPPPPPPRSMAARVRAARRLYRWATAIVASYSFVLGDDRYQALVPVWDALNHVSGRVNVRLAHDKGGGGVLRMVATRAIAPGEEVVNRYGPLSTSELLRGYGFVERGNPHAHAQVPAQFALRAAAGARGDEDDGTAAARAPPPEAWAAMGERMVLVDSDAEVDLDLEDDDDDEEEPDDDRSCSDADSGGEEDEEGRASEDDDDDATQEDAGAVAASLLTLSEAQRRAPCWPLAFCAARALRLLPRGGAFRVPGVPEAEDDERAWAGGDGEEEDQEDDDEGAAPATDEEQRALLESLTAAATTTKAAATGPDSSDRRRAEAYAAARRAARSRFPDALAAFVLLCLHACTKPLPEEKKRRKGRRQKGAAAEKRPRGDEDEDEEDDAAPKPPPALGAVASHLTALADGATPPPDALLTARALLTISPADLRAACLALLAGMRRRYAGGGLERDRARAEPARLARLPPRRAAALLARLEEQEALEAARAGLEEGGAEAAQELAARAAAAVWVALVRRAGLAAREAAKREAEDEDEDEDEEDEDDEDDSEGGGGGAGHTCGGGKGGHCHHHHPKHQKKSKAPPPPAGFAFNFDV
jgi:SET domain-containing protein 6